MKSYQSRLFEQLELAIEDIENVDAIVQYDFTNVGMISLIDGLTVIDSWKFDVQTNRVHIIQREHTLGPRSPWVFWWNPSDPGDNDEVARFLEAWRDAASAHVRSKAL